jgi:hypothetical protein
MLGTVNLDGGRKFRIFKTVITSPPMILLALMLGLAIWDSRQTDLQTPDSRSDM